MNINAFLFTYKPWQAKAYVCHRLVDINEQTNVFVYTGLFCFVNNIDYFRNPICL